MAPKAATEAYQSLTDGQVTRLGQILRDGGIMAKRERAKAKAEFAEKNAKRVENGEEPKELTREEIDAKVREITYEVEKKIRFEAIRLLARDTFTTDSDKPGMRATREHHPIVWYIAGVDARQEFWKESSKWALTIGCYSEVEERPLIGLIALPEGDIMFIAGPGIELRVLVNGKRVEPEEEGIGYSKPIGGNIEGIGAGEHAGKHETRPLKQVEEGSPAFGIAQVIMGLCDVYRSEGVSTHRALGPLAIIDATGGYHDTVWQKVGSWKNQPIVCGAPWVAAHAERFLSKRQAPIGTGRP